MATSQAAAITDAALDAFIEQAESSDDVPALFPQLQKRLAERMLAGELTEHLGAVAGAEQPVDQPNHRDGTSAKPVLTESGALPLDIPRDRAGTFAPQIVPKGVRRLPQFDAKVRSLYARGVSVRAIQGHWEPRYQVEVSPAEISAVTDAAAVAALEEFAAGPWGLRYPAIVALWPRHWPYVRPVFAYPPNSRRLLYTTNAIARLHMPLRKIITSRGHFPTDEAATTLLDLALRNMLTKGTRGHHAWQAAMPPLAMLFGTRFTDHA